MWEPYPQQRRIQGARNICHILGLLCRLWLLGIVLYAVCFSSCFPRGSCAIQLRLPDRHKHNTFCDCSAAELRDKHWITSHLTTYSGADEYSR
jgi:hypothetical protein